jgi:predicted DNA-binding mobile mystery protein A
MLSSAMSKNIRLHQLDNALASAAPLKSVAQPRRGWIRAIRDALGMSGRQLAERMHIRQSTLANMEIAESQGTITIASLRKAAAALDCTFVYAVVPNHTLEATLRQQAMRKAREIMDRVSHTMLLEDQQESDLIIQQEVEELANELIRSRQRELWEKSSWT